MGKTLDMYGNYIGKYPYKTCKLVIGPLEAGAGMEYPTITLCASDQLETIVHEVGHNWFYGIIGNNERRYPWMDESINSYFDKVVTNALNESEAGEVIPDKRFYNPISRRAWISKHATFVGIRQMMAFGTSQAINLTSEAFSNGAYGLVIYGKGPLAFAYLREQIGDVLFFKCFRDYFQTWKFRHPLPGDIQRSFEQTCGFSLNWFFKDILSDVNSIDYISKGGGFRIKGSDSLDLYLRSKGAKPGDINPNGFLSERSFYNNGQKKRLVRLSLPLGYPLYDRDVQVNIMPFMGYNLYDGFYPMLVINNTLLNDRAIDYAFLPGYSFKNKSMNGWGKISYRYVSEKDRSYVEAGIQGQSYGLDFGQSIIQNSYYRMMPFLKWIKIGGKEGVSRVEKTFALQFIHTGLRNSSYEIGKDSLGNSIAGQFSSDYFFNYYRAIYGLDYRNLLDRITIGVTAEYGNNNKYDPGSSDYLKLCLKMSYSHQIKKDKYLRSEIFAGLFPYKSNSFERQSHIQDFFISGNSGAVDYTRSEVLLGRNENYFSPMFAGRQILERGGLRNIVLINSTDRYMLTWKNTIDFPGKLPISFYFDAGYMSYNKNLIGMGNSKETEFLYTGGIEVNIFSDVLKIVVPIVYSEAFSSYNQIDQSFINTIGFKLNLNYLEPNRLIKGLILDNKLSFRE
ncbi:MAG: hypothetical protein JNM67_00895 [Bacteroidetes bacterium]|nr:hypothetical protein [Bacteroidota bacterium]